MTTTSFVRYLQKQVFFVLLVLRLHLDSSVHFFLCIAGMDKLTEVHIGFDCEELTDA